MRWDIANDLFWDFNTNQIQLFNVLYHGVHEFPKVYPKYNKMSMKPTLIKDVFIGIGYPYYIHGVYLKVTDERDGEVYQKINNFNGIK